jgi:hypothetical protein
MWRIELGGMCPHTTIFCSVAGSVDIFGMQHGDVLKYMDARILGHRGCGKGRWHSDNRQTLKSIDVIKRAISVFIPSSLNRILNCFLSGWERGRMKIMLLEARHALTSTRIDHVTF